MILHFDLLLLTKTSLLFSCQATPTSKVFQENNINLSPTIHKHDLKLNKVHSELSQFNNAKLFAPHKIQKVQRFQEQ